MNRNIDKVLCKRTYMERIRTTSGKNIRWCKDKYYQLVTPNEFEIKNGIYCYIQIEEGCDPKEVYDFWNIKSESGGFFVKMTKKEFDKYFIDIDEIRDIKIKQILD